MKRLTLTALLIFLLVNEATAQFLESGVAVTAVTPVGNFSDIAGTGYGGVFMAKFGLPVIDLTGSVEYLSFSEKEIGSIKSSATMWSLNAGARISVFPFISAGAEIGNYWITATTTNGTENKNTENKIAFTPLVAAQFTMFEVSARYALMDNASFFAIRAGIYF
ncbi:MAG: hypothetical protein EHM47_01525 [Ignavibacteriales bacterium]|nr:MAG: hypothetical protein EHM47_01525 [Ignavibacteriales bacterium]